MPNFAVITVRGRPGMAENLVELAFSENGFSIQWADPWKGRASKNIRIRGFLGWDSSKTLSLEFSISPQKEVCVLRVHKAGTSAPGAAALLAVGGGGSLGYHVASGDQAFMESANDLVSWFRKRGVLQDTTRNPASGVESEPTTQGPGLAK